MAIKTRNRTAFNTNSGTSGTSYSGGSTQIGDIAVGNSKKAGYMMGSNLRNIQDVTNYNLYKGITDFTQLEQFGQFESGYPFMFIISTPKFMDKLALSSSWEGQDTASGIDASTISNYYGVLTKNFKHILEGEFKGLSGLDGLGTDVSEINDGIQGINLISKVNTQGSATVSMNYVEKVGSPLTKYIKTYLTGIKDPRSQIKQYHGLIHNGVIEDPGPQHEVFSFLYFVTDNTARRLEQAYLLAAAQITGTSEGDLYGAAKGDISNKEITIEFNCIPLQSEQIDEVAQQVINRMNDAGGSDVGGKDLYREFNSYRARYEGTKNVETNILGHTGTTATT